MFCKLYNSNPFLFSETFSFRSTINLSETFYWDFLTNGKRTRSWFWISSAQPIIIVSPIKQLPLHHPSAKLLNFCLINARSINNKSLQIKDNLVDQSFDILALTETWLRANECSDFITRDISPTGYAFSWKLMFLNRLNLRNYYYTQAHLLSVLFLFVDSQSQQEWSHIYFIFRWIFHVTWATSICLW